MKKTHEVEKRKKLGRPRLNPEHTRSNRIVTFVTNAELDKLEHIADEKKLSVSSVVHKIIRNFL